MIKKLPTDLPKLEQLLRPIYLMQIIFAGYMCCTSIFYYLNALGFEYTSYLGPNPYQSKTIFFDIANTQRYYVLAHAALVSGLLYAMDYTREKKYELNIGSMSKLLIQISIICLPLGFIFEKIPGLNQFSIQLSGLSFVAGTIALAFAFRERNRKVIVLTAGLFVINLIEFLGGGFKEPIIISFLLLGIYLLPIFGKKVIPVFGAILIMLFLLLPTFVGNFRSLSGAGLSAEEARDQSLNVILEGGVFNSRIQNENWLFLTHRLSEMDMFIQFSHSTPQFKNYYKFDLVNQALYTPIPRVLWPSKPDMERQVMERVYAAGVVDHRMLVSAKPAYVVDAYLSYGAIGIIIALFLYGYFAQKISNKAEHLFGGYFLGSAVMFAGLFQIFWRGNSFEFMFNAVFWSYITMLIVFQFLKARGIIVQKY
ncbi:MAG: hypothetical protein EOO99_07415 [Pedobacter sp.]|nr:MAG: hypothetical protein EOO99_07415 [Pedobacter sp.]